MVLLAACGLDHRVNTLSFFEDPGRHYYNNMVGTSVVHHSCSTIVVQEFDPLQTSLLGVKAVGYPVNAARSTNVCQSQTNPWLVFCTMTAVDPFITKQKHRDYGQFVVP